jgi:uncharacterized protein (DUF4415 family)
MSEIMDRRKIQQQRRVGGLPENRDASTERTIENLIEELFGDPLRREPSRRHVEKWRITARRKRRLLIELDVEVLKEFVLSGRGWEERINKALKDWLKRHDPSDIQVRERRRR